MLEFAQKFADLTIKMREAEIAKTIAITLRDKLMTDRTELIRGVDEFVSGVFDVKQGHVVVNAEGNLSFYEKNND